MDELTLLTHAQTDPGLVHDRNEDQHAVFDTPDGGSVLLVCDGMGGMGRGDEASRVAVDALRATLQQPTDARVADRLADAVRAADATVREELCNSGDGSQPGSTAVMVFLRNASAYVCWVGDSRAYLIRGGAVIGRTRDHKLVEDLVDAGQMSATDARHSSLAHVVTRALGGKGPSEPGVTPATLPRPWRLHHGDRLLVCSDGLTDLVDDEELPALIEASPLEEVTERLVSLANERGGHDNITCIVAVWEGPDWLDDGSEPEEDLTEVDDPPLAEPTLEAPRPAPEAVARGPLPEAPAHPVDVEALARDLMPWWIATAALLLCAVVAGIVAAFSS